MMQRKSFMTALIIATVVGVAFAAPMEHWFRTSNINIPSGKFDTEKTGESLSTSLWENEYPSDFLFSDGDTVASTDHNSMDAADTEVPSISATPDNGEEMEATESTSETPLYNQKFGVQEFGNKIFNLIFAIPIKILKFVNAYLNQKQLLQVEQEGFTEDGVAVSEVENPEISITVQTNYDAIFNISSAILNAVQNLLNSYIRRG